MANIGALSVDLRLISQKFESGIKSASNKLKRFRATTQAATKAMGGMQGQIAAVAGAASLGLLIKKSLDYGDALAKTADSLGTTTEMLAGLHHAANQTGISTEGMNKSLRTMAKNIGEVATTGSGVASKVFEKMGLEAKALAKLNPGQQFQAIAKGLESVGTHSEKVFIAQQLFGKEGSKLLKTLDLGSEGLNAMIVDAERLGIAINRVDAAKIEVANDAIDRSQKAIQGAALKVTTDLAPVIAALADHFTETTMKSESFGKAIENAFVFGAKAVGVFADGIQGVKVVFKAVEVVVTSFSAAVVGVFNGIIKAIVKVRNFVVQGFLTPIRGALELASKFSDAAAETLEKLNSIDFNVKPPPILDESFNKLSARISTAKTELHDLMMTELPSARIQAVLDEVLAKAEVKANEIAQIAQNRAEQTSIEPLTDDQMQDVHSSGSDDKKQQKDGELESLIENNKKKEQAEKSHLDRLAQIKIGSSKKVAAAQKLIALKTVIMDGFVAIQKAWGSAPFPYNMPAVAIATASTAANVAGVRGSRRQGGSTLPNSLYEVNEHGMPELYEQNGKQYLMTGTKGGRVTSHNQSMSEAQGASPTIHFSISAGDVSGFDNWYQDNRQSIINDVRYGMEQF